MPPDCLVEDHHFLNGGELKLYVSEYGVGGATYGSHIEARTWTHAEQLALSRGLNERILGESELRDPKLNLLKHISEGEWHGALHEAVFMCFVGLSSGALSVREVLGDQGLIHEITHALHIPEMSLEIETVGAGGELLTVSTPMMELLDEEDKREAEERLKRITTLARDFMRRVPGWPAALHEEHMRLDMKLKCPCPNCVEADENNSAQAVDTVSVPIYDTTVANGDTPKGESS